MQPKTVPEPFNHIIETLKAVAKKHQFVLYAVGGFVRDLYLGRESKDLDIMVEGENGGIRFAETVARELNIRGPVIFPRFGTAKLSIEGQEIEFVMPRTEYYTDESRNPDTSLGTLEQDARRRDFTVNALFWCLNDGKTLDLTGRGFADISTRTIRVTDPEHADVIFSQDPLRMMRAVRQSVQLGFTIEPLTYAAIAANVFRLDIVSVERIQDELNKMLLSIDPVHALKLLVETGLFRQIFPEKGMDVLRLCLQSDMNILISYLPQDLALRLSALLYYVPQSGIVDAELSQFVMGRLKYSKDLKLAVSKIIRFSEDALRYESSWTDSAVRLLIMQCGEYVPSVLSFSRAHARMAHHKTSSLSALDELERRINEVQQVLAVKDMGNILSGEELMRLFDRRAGPWIQKVKEILLKAQFDNPALTKEQARAIVRVLIDKKTF
ncbi:MAG: CCA tRNA nucleotidyltransferase [Endomicrobiales bacterium]